MDLQKKIEFVNTVSVMKLKIDFIAEKFEVLLAESTRRYNLPASELSAVDKCAAECVIAMCTGETGQTVRAAVAKVSSIYDRLISSNGEDEIVLELVMEIQEVRLSLLGVGEVLIEIEDKIRKDVKTAAELN